MNIVVCYRFRKVNDDEYVSQLMIGFEFLKLEIIT